MKRYLPLFLLLFIVPFSASAQQGLDTLSLESIFYEPLLAGHRPDFVRYSPSDPAIYYQANDSAMTDDELFQVDLNGKNRKRITDDFQQRYQLSPDKQHVAYVDSGDIWIADANFEHARKLVSTSDREYGPEWSPNSRRLAYIQNGDVWIMDIDQSLLARVTHKKKDAPDYSISGWAGNQKLILHQHDTSDEATYYFPEYIHDKVQTGSSKRGIARQVISVANLDSNSVNPVFDGKEYVSTSTSADGKYLALDRIDADMKHRIIEVYNLNNPDSDSTAVFQDSTKGWLYGTDLAFAPEGNKLMIRSEKDGWNHIYTVLPDGSKLTQHTNGQFEVPWAEWLDGDKIVFASTKTDPGERQIYTFNTQNDEVKKLTSKDGFREYFELGPDKKWVVYQYSYFNEPWELYALNLNHPGKEIRLTQTIPDRFKEIGWQKPHYLRIPGRDGEIKISMTVLKPQNLKQDEKHPVVVFVHGAGSLQNVFKGWSNHYYREYMFNQFLTAHGYYVMQVDYRHSTGYGRKFREDVTNWMGKYETQDIEDGIKYLAKNYAGADTSRVGIYGGSYGGFLSLYTISTAPEYFDAAAALRAVTDWKNYYNYNPWYTRPRLGTPQADSANYARSSPITYADSLKQPVLLLQGLRDSNVGFKDMAEYVHALIESQNNNFQMMMYPTQGHGLTDPDSWYDEYSRIFKFFQEYLK